MVSVSFLISRAACSGVIFLAIWSPIYNEKQKFEKEAGIREMNDSGTNYGFEIIVVRMHICHILTGIDLKPDNLLAGMAYLQRIIRIHPVPDVGGHQVITCLRTEGFIHRYVYHLAAAIL